ncbi:hypothetical protein BJ742DRAFT_808705 [Cladochytrium replicatum]|nr:hypothetical protein BJ742DRAFT_808705 [Cladochytrium replicatum]
MEEGSILNESPQRTQAAVQPPPTTEKKTVSVRYVQSRYMAAASNAGKPPQSTATPQTAKPSATTRGALAIGTPQQHRPHVPPSTMRRAMPGLPRPSAIPSAFGDHRNVTAPDEMRRMSLLPQARGSIAGMESRRMSYAPGKVAVSRHQAIPPFVSNSESEFEFGLDSSKSYLEEDHEKPIATGRPSIAPGYDDQILQVLMLLRYRIIQVVQLNMRDTLAFGDQQLDAEEKLEAAWKKVRELFDHLKAGREESEIDQHIMEVTESLGVELDTLDKITSTLELFGSRYEEYCNRMDNPEDLETSASEALFNSLSSNEGNALDFDAVANAFRIRGGGPTNNGSETHKAMVAMFKRYAEMMNEIWIKIRAAKAEEQEVAELMEVLSQLEAVDAAMSFDKNSFRRGFGLDAGWTSISTY